ncbi:TPA: APC family permease [Klebsiella pneumoniae subsp. pneumoniae]|nr:APC family permease [Klebsiella pneumoniae subsp. pneumoniae]
MFSNRLASHLERGVVGFPTTLASSVGLIMASPVILTVTSGFGMGGDTFALAVLLAFIMMQAQVTTFAEAATLIPTTGSVYDYISCGMGRFFAITGALCAYLIVHIFAGTAETILAGIMALVNFESINAQMAAHQNTWMVGVGMVVIFGLLNAIGVEIFGKVEVVLTFGMWTTLTIFGLCGIFMAPVTHLSGWFGTPLNVSDINGLFGYIGMAMFMFVGCELVTPMAPEIKQAHRTIPRAMALGLLGVASCMFIYGAAIIIAIVNITPPGMDSRQVLVPFGIMLGLTAAYALFWTVCVQRVNPFKPLVVEEVVERAINNYEKQTRGEMTPDVLRPLV